MLDVAVAMKRYAFLGPEFLTWLWYVSENTISLIAQVSGEPAEIFVGNRIVLEKSRRDDVERITIRGDEAQMDEGVLALKKGALVKDVNLVLEIGEQKWTFNINGETFALSGLKTPPTAPVRIVDEMEGAIIEKAALCEKPLEIMQKLFNHFISIRISESWRDEVLSVRKWITEFEM